MATNIDSLEVKINTTIGDCNQKLDRLISKLSQVSKALKLIQDGKTFEPLTQECKKAEASANSVKKASEKVIRSYEDIKKASESLINASKDKANSFVSSHSVEEIRKQMKVIQNAYDSAKVKLAKIDLAPKNMGAYEKATKDVIGYEAELQRLKEAIADIEARDMERTKKHNAPVQTDVTSEELEREGKYLDEIRNQAQATSQSLETITQANKDITSSTDEIAKPTKTWSNVVDGLKDTMVSVGYSARTFAENVSASMHGAKPSAEEWKGSLSGLKVAFQDLRSTVGDTISVVKNSDVGTVFSSLGDKVSKVGSNIKDKITNTFDNMLEKSHEVKQEFSKGLVDKGILTYTEKYASLRKELDKTKKHLSDLKYMQERFLATGGKTTDTTYKKYAYDIVDAEKKLNQLAKTMDEVERKNQAFSVNTKSLKNSFSGLKNVGDGISKTFSKIWGALGKVGSAIKNAVGHFNILDRSTKKTKKSTDLFNVANVKLVKSLFKTAKMLKLMITRMVLRQVIKGVTDGFKNLAQYSDTVNASMSLLWNSFRQLGNSIASAVAPLINAFAPALNQIIQLVISATNYINQLLSALTGMSTWTRAKTLTDSYAESLDKTSASAKKANKQLQSFDALNNLTTQDSDTGTSPADMFEEVEVSDKMKELSDWLKDMWESGDFFELGKKLGEKLKDWLDAIPWAKIRSTANKLGKSLASLINGFVSVDGLGRKIGESIAQSLNTIVEFINGFVHELDWDKVGDFIADMFNGFFEGIDWKLIRDTVITGIKGLAKSINAFIKKFNWDNISKTIIESVNLLVDAVYEFIADVKWFELGTKIGEQITKTIEGIEWYKMGNTFAEGINALWTFMNGVVGQIQWSEVGTAISDALNGLFDNIDWELIESTISDGFSGLSESINSFIDNFHWDNLSISVSNIINTLSTNIQKFFEETEWDELGTKLGEQLKKTIEGIKWEELGQSIGTVIQSAITFVSSLLSQLEWKDIEDAISDLLKGFFEKVDKDELGEIIAGVLGVALSISIGKTLLLNGISTLGQDLLTGLFSSTIVGEVALAIETVLNSALNIAIGSVIGVGIGSRIKDAIINSFAEKFNKENEGEQVIDVEALNEEYGGLGGTFRLVKNEGEAWWNALKTGSGIIASSKDNIRAYNQALEIAESGSIRNAEWFEKLSNVYGLTSDQIQTLKEKMFETSKQSDAWKGKTQELIDAMDYVPTITVETEKSLDKVKDSTSSMTKSMNDNFVSIRSETLEWSKTVDKSQQDIKKSNDKLRVDYDEVELAVANCRDTMELEWNEISKNTDESTEKIDSNLKDFRDETFGKDTWTLKGIKDGLKESFENAISSIKEIWNKFAEWLNDKATFEINPIEIGGKKITDGGKLELFHIPTYSTGGFVEDGLFSASSSELVGKFSNGKTAVANNQQIVDGIANGVASANAEQNQLLRQQNALLQGILDKEFGISSDTLFRSVQTSANSYYKRTGNYAF